MKKEIFDTLPYISRKELIDLRAYMNLSFDDNANLILDDTKESTLFQFRDYTGQYVYNISFVQFEPQNSNNIYKVYHSPKNLSSIEGRSNSLTFEQIKSSFPSWVEIITKMHGITKEYYDPYRKFYEEEFSDFFTNNDEDSYENPFEIERQEILYYFLTFAEKKIEYSVDIDEENKAELLEEVIRLKEELPKTTKKRFVSNLSKFAQKSKKTSNKLFHDIFDVLKKEIIKKMLYKGAEEIPSIIHKIDGWIKLFT